MKDNCPNCDRNNIAHRLNIRGLWFFECANCGVCYQPNIDGDEINKFYSSGEYRSKHGGNREEQNQQKRAEHIMQYIDRPTVFVDFGSSMGMISKAVSDKYKCKTYNVDIDTMLTKGVKTYKSISDIGDPADCVTIIHTLEHIARPLDLLKEINAHMVQGGQLIIEVPNGDIHAENKEYYNSAFSAPHIVMFSRDALEWTMRAAGFDVQEAFTHGRGGLSSAESYYYLLGIGVKR